MFELFKERNFSDYINDTFGFFKVCGKHFFKLYFMINGSLLLVATALLVFMTRMFFEFVAAAMSGIGIEETYVEDYITANQGVLIISFIAVAVFFMFLSILQYAFPVVYFDLYDARKGSGFGVRDILNALKKKAWKIVKFIIGFIFIMLPLLFIVFGINTLLFFIVIGLPLLILTVPMMVSFICLSFYYYLNSDESFFSALGDAFDTIRGQFWPVIFSTLVTLIVYYIASTVVTMVPYLVMMGSMFTTIDNSNPQESLSFVGIMFAVVMVISMIVGSILINVVLINQGMVYYSHIENAGSSVSNNSIDLIGTDSE